MSTLTSTEHTAIGALAGVLEVSVMQPTVTIKNALQEGRALPKSPIALYRGYLVSASISTPYSGCVLKTQHHSRQRLRLSSVMCAREVVHVRMKACRWTLHKLWCLQVNAGSIAPITAVQFGANRFYELTLRKLTGKDPNQASQVALAVAAGSTSSLISTPAELIMIQQGRNQRPLMAEARSYIGKHGLTALYRGFVSTPLLL